MIDKGIRYKERTGFFSAGLARGDSISPGTSTSGGSRNTGGGGSDNNHSRFDVGSGYYGETKTTPSASPSSNNDGPTARDLAMGAGGKQKTGTITNIEELSKATGTDFSGGAKTSPALEKARLANVDLVKELTDRPFQGVNVPPYIPFSGAINALGNLFGGFSYEANKKFFQENVAGNKGYGYGYDDFKDYMQDRGFGKVDAYGNPIDQSRGGDDGEYKTSGILENLLLDDIINPPTPSPTGFNYVPYSNQVVVAPGIEGLRSLMGSDAFKSIIK